MTDDQTPDRLLSIAPAARMFGVSVNTLARWADEGMVPCTRTIGRARRFSEAKIQEIIDTLGRP